MSESVESRTARQVLVVAAIALGLWLCVELKVILVDVVVAITLASAIAPIAVKAETWKIPRTITAVLIYGLIAGLYTLIGYILWTNPNVHLTQQFGDLSSNVPKLTNSCIALYNETVTGFGIHSNFKLEQKHLEMVGTVLLNKTLDISAGALGVVLNIVLILFLTVYFVGNSKSIWSSILRWLPVTQRPRIEALIQPVGNRMGGYVRGQLLVSTAVGAFFAIGLSILQVPAGLVIGLLAGLFNLIPFAGSMIATVLAVFMAAQPAAAGGDFQLLKAGLTIGLFVLEQTIESNFIVPYLLGSQVDLNPLVVLMAILIGATIGGGVGALIAVPIAAALLQISDELYLKPMHEQEALAQTP